MSHIQSRLTPNSDADDPDGDVLLKLFDDIDIVFTGMWPGEKLFEELAKLGRERANSQFLVLSF